MKKLLFLVFLMTMNGILGGVHDTSADPELQGRIIWDLQTDKDYRGPVQRGAIDPEGKVAYLATRATLYEIRDGNVRAIAERPDKEARLVLAPGGVVYGWLRPHRRGRGLFDIQLFNIPRTKIADLELKDIPRGFNTLYLGLQGKLIVTVSPLDDWEGIRGRFQFNFWNRQAEMLKKVVLEGRQVGILDPTGEAILLLGEKEAISFSASGKELWRLPGRFRNAALAGSGRLALLNPNPLERINEVLIYKGEGEPVTLSMRTPVHGLTLTPDGSLAVVVGDRGHYSFLDPSAGKLLEGTRLPLQGTFYIMNLKFIDANTLAMGVLYREGETPKVTWPRGTILIIDLKGEVAFQRELSIRQATAGDPNIDVAFGNRFIIGYTRERTILIELGHKP
jgi:hypothetical protein